jgi:hypothetical protein
MTEFVQSTGMAEEESDNSGSSGEKQDYIFDDEIFQKKPQLLDGLRAKAPVVATEAVSNVCNNVKQQLIVGPARSCAHMHYHQGMLPAISYVGFG